MLVATAALLCSCTDTTLTPSFGEVPESILSGQAIVDHWQVEGDFYVSPLLDTPEYATRVGLLVEAQPDSAETDFEFAARALDRFGQIGSWRPCETTWREPPRSVARADLRAIAVGAQLRVPLEQALDIRELTWSAIVPVPRTDDGDLSIAQAPAQQQQALAGYLSSISMRSRADWGARARTCGTLESSKYRMAVHHSAGNSGTSDYAAAIRGIQSYHMDTRDYCDMAYHFVISSNGQLWEGREIGVRGGHVLNQNTGNVGLVYMGCFVPGGCVYSSSTVPETPIAQPMIDNAGSLVAALGGQFGIAINSDKIRAHRDHDGASTTCPGTSMHSRMSDILNAAQSGGTVTPPPPTSGFAKGVVYDSSVTSGPSDPGNVRITNATVTCAGVGSESVEADDAYWSFELQPGTHTFTASAPGFADTTREIVITAGADSWGSIGIVPQPTAVEMTVLVHDADLGTGAPLSDALVAVAGQDAQRTGSNGSVSFSVPAGAVTIDVSREGFLPQQVTPTAVVGTPLNVQVGLDSIAVDAGVTDAALGEDAWVDEDAGPGTGNGQGGSLNGQQSPPGPSDPATYSLGPTGGCACSQPRSSNQSAEVVSLLVLALALVSRRRASSSPV